MKKITPFGDEKSVEICTSSLHWKKLQREKLLDLTKKEWWPQDYPELQETEDDVQK